MLTEWAEQFTNSTLPLRGLLRRRARASWRRPTAAPADADGKTVGLNIGLPFEQFPNPYITPELSFEFHYFFMRKFWFAYLAKALVVFPGGFGTLDELMEILTLTQTQKLAKKMTVLLYGSDVLEGDHQLRRAGEARHDLARGPEPVSVRRRPADRVRAAEDRADRLRVAAGYAGDAGDFEIRQSAEAGRSMRAECSRARWRRVSRSGCSTCKDAETHLRRGGAQSRLPARVAAVGGFHDRRRKTCGDSSRGCASSSTAARGPNAAIWIDGAFAGSVGCHPIDWPNRNCSIGYWIEQRYQGKGIMTRCCASMLDYLFDDLGLHRVTIQCGVANTRSCAIPERLGSRAKA